VPVIAAQAFVAVSDAEVGGAGVVGNVLDGHGSGARGKWLNGCGNGFEHLQVDLILGKGLEFLTNEKRFFYDVLVRLLDGRSILIVDGRLSRLGVEDVEECSGEDEDLDFHGGW
jgi:hypothetical protein